MTINYQEYIRSAEWREKADAAKERAGHRCQVCNTPDNMASLEAHHRTYERLGREADDDITVLCDECHDLFSRNHKMQTQGISWPQLPGLKLRRKKSRVFVAPPKPERRR